jgi:polyisoprenyl-teichoic acid--peptidoglycan teichoic acid transferase
MSVSNEPTKKQKWYRRTPGLKRFIFWNLLCWCFGISAMIGGTLYTEHIVRPIAETGSDQFSPIGILEKEQAGKRVFGSTERLNILVVGIDYNYNNQGILYTKGARSDTIIVLSLSRDAQYFNVVSIPRDTQVLISSEYGHDKVNSAYSYGGINQTRQTVSDFLGIPIHHHVILKVSGAKDVVDALGGLPINVEKNMDYDDNWGKLHIHLKKGPQVLDGEQAVGYARFRMDEEGDRGRIRRQQQVIRALGRKLKEPALLGRLNDLAKVVQQSIETDLKLLQMVDLANLYSSFDFSKMRSASIVGDDAVDANGISYIVPYEPENRRTVRRLLQNLDWLRKDDLRIRIYFKKAPSNLAYDLADRLYDAGFRGVQVEALPWDSDAPTEKTNLFWYNEVPRLDGVLKAVVGPCPSSTGVVPEGRDDDIAIYLGDGEEGRWSHVPDRLLQERESIEEDLERAEDRVSDRYQSGFIPRSLPPSDNELYDSPPLEIKEPESFDDAVKPDYPTTPDSRVEATSTAPTPPIKVAPELPAPSREQTSELPPPMPQEVKLEIPTPAATPISPTF